MKQIPAQRLLLYTLITSIFLIGWTVLHVYSSITQTERQQNELSLLGEKITKVLFHQKNNRRILAKFKDKDPLFLQKQIEPFQLLSQEKELIQKKLSRSFLPEDVLLKKRFSFLSSADNKLSFVESSIETGPSYKETIEHQARPVEASTQDLLSLLSILETDLSNPDETKPHLIISEAKIERKKSLQGDVWGILLNIIRREYSPSC